MWALCVRVSERAHGAPRPCPVLTLLFFSFFLLFLVSHTGPSLFSLLVVCVDFLLSIHPVVSGLFARNTRGKIERWRPRGVMATLFRLLPSPHFSPAASFPCGLIIRPADCLYTTFPFPSTILNLGSCFNKHTSLSFTLRNLGEIGPYRTVLLYE